MPEQKTPGLGDPRFHLTVAQQMIASCTGAVITSLLMTPFDVVKIRLQAQQKNINKCFLYCNGLMDHLCPCITAPGSNSVSPQMQQYWYQKHGHFSGTVDAFVKIARNEGLVSLWSGLSPTLVLAVPCTVMYFTTYENLKLFIKDYNRGEQPYWGPPVAGAAARAWAVTVVSPLELIRTKMQSKKISYLEIGQAIKSMVQTHGFLGLFKGLNSTLLRDVPFSAIYWFNYELVKSLVPPDMPVFGSSFLSGFIAGSVAATITTPFDVVKTHQQIELGEKEIYTGKKARQPVCSMIDFGSFLKDTPSRSSNMAMVIRRIYSNSGVSGLFAGLAPRLVKVAPACAIMISSYEYGKTFFYRHNYNKHQNKSVDYCSDIS